VVETDRGQFVKVPTKRLESLAELYAASWLVRVMRQYGTHLAVGGLGVLGTFLWHWFSAAR
jgi:hypothetical protein